MATTFGHIWKFEPENESISMYVEHLQLLFEANRVAKDNKCLSYWGQELCLAMQPPCPTAT